MIDEGDLKPTTLVGDPLYLIVAEPPGNALVGFNFKQRTTEVLASTRRRPAVSPFDDPGLQIKSAVTNEAGEVVVVAETIARPVPQIERVIHAWSPTQRLWREIHPGTSKSTVPLNLQQPADSEYPRVGKVGKSGGNVVLHFFRKDASDIPLGIPTRGGSPTAEVTLRPTEHPPGLLQFVPRWSRPRTGFRFGLLGDSRKRWTITSRASPPSHPPKPSRTEWIHQARTAGN